MARPGPYAKIDIRGETWKVVIGRPGINNAHASIDYDTHTILISPNARNRKAALIHEILHAALPDLNEAAVTETEVALLRGLKLLEAP